MGVAATTRQAKNRIQVCRRTDESKQVGERQDPPEQVKVNASAVFSLWWCCCGCVFCMVPYGVVAVLFSNLVTFSNLLSKKTCPRNVFKRYVPESWSRIVFEKRVQHTCKKHVPSETCPRNAVKKCRLEETCPTNH